MPFANTPEPPYYAVIFTSAPTTRAPGDGYAETDDRMMALARAADGFLGVESAGGAELGVTVSYWRDEAAIRAFKRHVEHEAAQERGRAAWYARYAVRVARVERAYGWSIDTGHDAQ